MARGGSERKRRQRTDVDRALMLAYSLYLDGLCGVCSQPRDRAWNPDSEGNYATLAHHCESCRAIERRSKLEKDRNQTKGLQVGVVDLDPHRHLRDWDPMTTLHEG